MLANDLPIGQSEFTHNQERLSEYGSMDLTEQMIFRNAKAMMAKTQDRYVNIVNMKRNKETF